MSKTKWTPQMVAEMVTAVESKKSRKAGVVKAAKLFKVTPIAIEVKYSRVKRANPSTVVLEAKPLAIPKKSKGGRTKGSKNKPKVLSVLPASTFGGKNLFKIDNNTPLVGNRRGVFSKELLSLAEIAKMLPVDSNKSICIPKSIAKTKSEASNLVLGLKRIADARKDFPKEFTVTTRTVNDAEGNYSHSRIWRVA